MTRGTNHQYVDEIVNRFIASDPEEFSDSTTQGDCGQQSASLSKLGHIWTHTRLQRSPKSCNGS